MKIPIKALKELSKQYGLNHVVVFATDNNNQHIATYGKSTEQSGQAADFGNTMKSVLHWPDSLQAQPSRVRKLQAEIKELKTKLELFENKVS